MSLRAFHWLENPSGDPRVLAGLVRRLFDMTAAGVLTPLVCLLALTLYFLDRTGIAGPALVILLHVAGAVGLDDLRRRYYSAQSRDQDALGWARSNAALSAVKAVSWALGGFVWMAEAQAQDVLIYGTLVAGVCTGVAVTRASYLPAGFLHIGIVGGGFLILAAQQGGLMGWLVPAGGLLYASWLAYVALLIHLDLKQTIALSLENLALVANLSGAQSAERAARATAEAARDKAEAAMRAKSEFLAIVSHELRTPLNGILGMTSVLADTDLNEPQRKSIATIKDAGESLCLIIDDLLDLTRLESGNTRLEPQEFNLHRLVESAAQILRVRAWEKRLKLTCEIAPDVPPMVFGDAGRLRQILINLAGNAVKFTDRGSVTIRAYRAEGAQHLLRFEVADTGIGIPGYAMDRLFKPFSQVDQSFTRTHGGTGLGLAIVQRLVTLMQGATGVESEVGVGSRFWVDIPLQTASSSAHAPQPPEALPASRENESTAAASLCILVTDDSPHMRIMLNAVLSAAGHRVIEADSGEEAIAELQRGGIDLVVLDQDMPGLDGAATARLVRAMPDAAGIPILALSGFDSAHLDSAGLAAAADAVLSKPVMPNVLLPTVLRVHGGRPLAAPRAFAVTSAA